MYSTSLSVQTLQASSRNLVEGRPCSVQCPGLFRIHGSLGSAISTQTISVKDRVFYGVFPGFLERMIVVPLIFFVLLLYLTF